MFSPTQGPSDPLTGLFISSDIPGRFLKFRINEWHRRHPGHLSATSVTSFTFENTSNSTNSPWDRCTLLPSHSIITSTVKTLNSSLSDANRAKAIERELKQLRSHPRVAPVTSPMRPSRSFIAEGHTVSPGPEHPILGHKTSNSSVSDANQVKVIKCELEQLRSRTRVALVA
jgi:hypothetical protein